MVVCCVCLYMCEGVSMWLCVVVCVHACVCCVFVVCGGVDGWLCVCLTSSKYSQMISGLIKPYTLLLVV